MNRTTFIIDGFNLYHSAVDASDELGGETTKWLDIHSLCSSFLYLIGNNAQLKNIYYFSALARHKNRSDPGKVSRHLIYIKCLESTGVEVKLARF